METAVKLCECGCGEPVPLAAKTRPERSYVKGQPLRFATPGHASKTPEGRARAARIGSRYGRFNLNRGNHDQPTGSAHPSWRGDEASYQAVHHWVRKHFEKTGICECCGTHGRTEWANKSGEYRREDRSDWEELCRSCHVIADGLVANLKQNVSLPRRRAAPQVARS